MPLSRLSVAAVMAASLTGVCPARAIAQTRQTTGPTPAAAQMMARIVPRIPDVVGKMVDSAISALAFTRLPIVRVDIVTTAQPTDHVVEQRPGRGTLVTATKAETLFVSARRKVPTAVFVSPAKVVAVPPVHVDSPVTHVPVPRDTTVPDLYGRTPNLVSAALEMTHLRPGRVFRDSSDDMVAGRVFHQDPPAGTRVGLGSIVSVWYSLGAHHALDTVGVPLVEGRSIDEARVALKRRTLNLGRVTTEYRRDASGRIVHQEPHAGATAHLNDSVDVTIALEPPLLPVPNVIGLSNADARAKIEGAGLDVGAVSIITRTGATATIDSQRPPAGARVPPRSLVDLVEADAPVIRRAVVPNLIGMTEAAAERAVRADSLELGTVVRPDDDVDAKVVAQDPPGGQSAMFHSRVNVRMSAPPPPETQTPSQRPDSFVRVPPVVNLTVGDAERALAQAGFSHIGIFGDSATAAAVVVAQTPRAGTLALTTALVTLAAERVVVHRVPSLLDRNESDARDEAERDQFFMRVVNRNRKFRLTDVVVRQTPIADAPDRGDRRIEVDLDIPVVPPMPAAILLGVAGIAGETFRRRKKPGSNDSFVLSDVTPVPSMPTVSSSGGPKLIRSMVEFEFTYEVSSPTWDVECRGDTLITSKKVHNG